MKYQIKITPNYNKRTFTIRKNGTKYRTCRFSKEEFLQNCYNTIEDWINFLKNEDFYYQVK